MLFEKDRFLTEHSKYKEICINIANITKDFMKIQLPKTIGKKHHNFLELIEQLFYEKYIEFTEKNKKYDVENDKLLEHYAKYLGKFDTEFYEYHFNEYLCVMNDKEVSRTGGESENESETEILEKIGDFDEEDLVSNIDCLLFIEDFIVKKVVDN